MKIPSPFLFSSGRGHWISCFHGVDCKDGRGTQKTFCKKYHKHPLRKVTQYKKGKPSLYTQRKRYYNQKQSGYSGPPKPVF
ncbi:60S ribosomal protein L36a [Lemmus lemmus]